MLKVHLDPFPFTADDIRADLGLFGRQMDPIIDTGIASACMRSTKAVRKEVWAIADGSEPPLLGIAASVGLPYQPVGDMSGRWFRDHTFLPTAEAVETVHARIVRWCLNQHDIALAIAAERNAAASFSPASADAQVAA